jgi:hypothetical protein
MIEQLNDSSAPFLDRPAVERLFRIGRRQAIRILGYTNGYKVGKTFLVDRACLIQFLREIQDSGAVGQSVARKDRVAAAMNTASRFSEARKVQIRTSRDPSGPTDAGAAAVRLVHPGKIEICFASAEELLSHIVNLVTAATHDFPSFRRKYEGH